MSRIPLIEKTDASVEVNKVYDELEKQGFSILNVVDVESPGCNLPPNQLV